jgi:hypothetical protein
MFVWCPISAAINQTCWWTGKQTLYTVSLFHCFCSIDFLRFSHSCCLMHSSSTSIHIYMLDSIFYTVSVILSYLIMLLIMTYNVGICVLVVLSCGLSHFVVTYSFVRYYRNCKAKGTRPDTKDSDVRLEADNNQVRTINADHCCENIDFDSE